MPINETEFEAMRKELWRLKRTTTALAKIQKEVGCKNKNSPDYSDGCMLLDSALKRGGRRKKRRKSRKKKRKTKRKKRKRKRKTKRKRRGGTNGSTGATKSPSPSPTASTGSTGSRSETLQGMIRQGAIINHGRRVAQRSDAIGNRNRDREREQEAARRGIDPSRLLWANGTWIQMGGRRRKTKKKRRR